MKLILRFIQASAQQELAYRTNFWIHLLYASLNLLTGFAGLFVLFTQVKNIQRLGLSCGNSCFGGLPGGWRNPRPCNWPQPGRPGGDGTGNLERKFDFALLRPLDIQFLTSFRYWNLFSLLDLALGITVLIGAMLQPGQIFIIGQLLAFIISLTAAVVIIYAVLLAFTGFVFWSPGFLFAWAFDAVFQMARYPVDLYPGWLRLILTWIIPVGLMTTLPARVLTGASAFPFALVSVGVAVLLVSAASVFSHYATRHYVSASS